MLVFVHANCWDTRDYLFNIAFILLGAVSQQISCDRAALPHGIEHSASAYITSFDFFIIFHSILPLFPTVSIGIKSMGVRVYVHAYTYKILPMPRQQGNFILREEVFSSQAIT